jgi:large subunit ribosomal protein L9
MGKRVKIIMSQDVINIGEEGDICEVSPGYARNYLFPQKMAVPYNKNNLNILGQRMRIIEKRKEEKRVQAQGVKEQMQKEEIVFMMPAGDNGKLFGSITNGNVAEELHKRGFSIEKKKIDVPDHHLKSVGEYNVTIHLYGNEEAVIKVSIKALETAQEQKAEGKTAKGERTRQRAKRQTKEKISGDKNAQEEVTAREQPGQIETSTQAAQE